MQVLDKVRVAHNKLQSSYSTPTFFSDRVNGTQTHLPDQVIVQAVTLIDQTMAPATTAAGLDAAKNKRNANVHSDNTSDLDSRITQAIADLAALPKMTQELNSYSPLLLKILKAWPLLKLKFGL